MARRGGGVMTVTMAGPAGLGPSFPAGGGERLNVNVADRETLFDLVAARLAAGRGFTVATLNLDHLVKLRRDPAFRAAYRATDFVVADGNPVVWLSRLAGRKVGLAPGSELVGPLCALAARLDAPVALYGSTTAALDEAAERLEAAHPGLRVVFRRAPAFGFDPDGAVATADAGAIAESGARLCLLALGAPRQERFAVRAQAAAPACGFVSVGAGVDFIAGTQTRAPLWARRLAMEWVWRVAMEPRRLGRRYADCALLLPSLLFESIRRRFGSGDGDARK